MPLPTGTVLLPANATSLPIGAAASAKPSERRHAAAEMNTVGGSHPWEQPTRRRAVSKKKPGDVQANQWPDGGVKVSPTVAGTFLFLFFEKKSSLADAIR
jgi:hypothetical protein